jgi:hypothetical protein
MNHFYEFQTTQSDLLYLNGKRCIILRSLREDEADREDVGIMYKVQFDDGTTINAFEDELYDFYQ